MVTTCVHRLLILIHSPSSPATFVPCKRHGLVPSAVSAVAEDVSAELVIGGGQDPRDGRGIGVHFVPGIGHIGIVDLGDALR